jgi:hypothetical protein
MRGAVPSHLRGQCSAYIHAKQRMVHKQPTTVIRVAFVAFYVIYLYDSAATFSLPRDHWVQATQSQSAGCTGPLSVVTQDSSCVSARQCSSREAQTGERGRERGK